MSFLATIDSNTWQVSGRVIFRRSGSGPGAHNWMRPRKLTGNKVVVSADAIIPSRRRFSRSSKRQIGFSERGIEFPGLSALFLKTFCDVDAISGFVIVTLVKSPSKSKFL